MLSHQTGLELFNVPHPAFQRTGSPSQMPMDFLRKTEETKTGTTPVGQSVRGSNSPVTGDNNSAKKCTSKKSNSQKNGVSASFSESIRRDAENEMEEYLLMFGGVSSVDTVSQSPVTIVTQPGDDHENDGDDEGASRDSGF